MCVKSMAFKRTILVILSLVTLAGLVWPVRAYEASDVVGTVPMQLRLEGREETKNATNQECSLGSAAADAVRHCTGCDLVILNGGDFRHGLQPGERTWAEIQDAFQENCSLAMVTVTGAELWTLLEHGVSHAVLNESYRLDREQSSFAGFPQVAGFSFTYDMSAPLGERVYKVELESGEELDPADTSRTFTLCATEFMLTGGYGYPLCGAECVPLELTPAQALAEGIAGGVLEETDYTRTRRVTVIGCGDDTLLSSSPMAVAILLLVLIAGTGGAAIKRKLKFHRD